MMDSEEEWWERTWLERENALHAFYGPTHPPDFPQGHVLAFPGGAIRVRVPGGCAYVYRPNPAGPPGARPDAWLYVSHGLTQPLDEATMLRERMQGSDRSSFGWEFAIELGEPAEWAPLALAYLAYYSREPDTPRLEPGSRMAFFLYQEGDRLLPDLGLPDERGDASKAAALLFWPDLRTERDFRTETGPFGVLVGTTVTADEWEMAKATSTTHVLALLVRAGIGQRSDPLRETVTKVPQWAAEWDRIRRLDHNGALAVLYGE